MSGIPEGTEHLRKIVGKWDEDHTEDTQPLDELAVLLFQHDMLIADVRMYRSRLEQEVAKRADTKLIVGDGWTAEVKPGTQRKGWDHPLLAGEIADRAKDFDETPEAAILRCAGIGYWRKGEVQKLGLDINDYCEVSYGPPHVVIRANEEKEEEAS